MVVNESQERPDVSFPGMDPTEEFRFYFRRHVSRLWGAIGVMVVWMALFAVGVYASGVYGMDDLRTARITIAILCLFVIVPQLAFAVRVYAHYLRIVIVTDKKVHQFKRTLLAVDRHESVDLWVLQDIAKNQRGIVQNVLGFGSLKLEAQNSRMTIHFTPRIDETYNKIVGLREEARRRMLPGQQAYEYEQSLPVQPS